MCVTTSWYKWQKSDLLSQNLTLQSIIYPPEKNSLEQAAFWHEEKVVCCLPNPVLTHKIDYIPVYPSDR